MLNPDQPYFVLSSVLLPSDVARELVQSHLPPQAKELHFQRLKESRRGQERILGIWNHPAINKHSAKLRVVNKEYAIIAKLVDLLVHTTTHVAFQRDINERGENIALANFWYYVVRSIVGEEAFEKFLRAFVRMLRERGDYHVDKFYQHAERLYRDLWNRQGEKSAVLVAPILASRELIETILKNCSRGELNPIVSSFCVLIDEWGKQLKTRFDAIFDESKVVEDKKFLIEALAHPEEPEVEIGWDRRTVVYPLKVDGLESVDSRCRPEIQIADVLASSVEYVFRKYSRGESADEFVKALAEMPIKKELPTFMKLPHKAFTPEELDTIGPARGDAFAHISGMLRRRIGEDRPASF